jgi:Meiotically Up-regulated Gene 113 (MUG113) protein
MANDLRLKDRVDPDYPNPKVFERFGTKAELVQELLKFCQARDGYDGVIQMCEAYTPRNHSLSREIAHHEEAIGFVYLIKSGRFHKIGKSNATGRREYELAIQLPERATTVHTIRTDDPSGIEAYWHKRFESKRKNGEWFELDAGDIVAFKRRKFM